MKRTLVAVAATLLVAVPATATATLKARAYYLDRGDTALVNGGDTACTVARLPGGSGFRCRVGGDYRALYGVTVNSAEVTVTRYTGFNRYRVLIRRKQSPLR